MSTIFEKNIQALMKTNPQLAAEIFGAKNKNFEVVQQGKDPINLNIIDIKNKYPIYKTQPLKEIMNKKEKFKEYERYPILFLFGMGNGIFIKLLFANKTHKKIIVIEPNLEILYIALNIVDISEEIKDEKLEIIYSKEFDYAKAISIFDSSRYQVFNKLFKLHICSTYYEKFYSQEIIRIHKISMRAITQATNNIGNSAIDTLIGIEHTIKNIPEMIKNIPYRPFAKNNKQLSEVAIIVSTGPSLEKQLPLLKEIQDFVTIISVDASLPILEKWEIKPDFVTSLERVEETAKFFKSTTPEFQKEIIMLHSALQHEEVLKNSYGKKCLVMRPFHFNQNFKLKNYGYLGIGMSAANMAYEFAYVTHYKKIILIGQDLAYAETGASHSKGHVYGEKEVNFKDDDSYVLAYGGEKMIRTTKTWNMFKNFFEKDIALTNREGIKTINATEGGARIEGTLEIPFKEAIKKHVNKKPKKKIKILYFDKKRQNKDLLKSYKVIQEVLEYGEKFQKRVEKLFLKVLKESKKLEKLNNEKKLDKIDFKKLLRLSNEIDKIKSKIETKKFFSMYGEVTQSELIHREMDLAKVQVAPSNNEIEKKAKLIDWIMKHKNWLFSLAGSINAQRVIIKRALPNLQKELQERKLLILENGKLVLKE